MLSKAINFYNQGQLEKALTILENLTNNKNVNIDELNFYAALLFETNDFDKAISIITKAILINPKNIILLNNRAQFYFKYRRYDESLKDLNAILKLKPTHAESYNNIGRIYLRKNDFIKATLNFDQAIKLNQSKNYYFYNKGNALFQMHKFEDAINAYNESIKLKPDHYKTYHNRGLSLQELLRLDEAMTDFDLSIQHSENFYEPHLAKAYLHLIRGEFKEGWKLHEYRWASDTFSEYLPKNQKSKLWLGQESLEDKTILLFSEQGLGDTIQFSRYIEKFKKFNCKTIILVQKSLLNLIRTIEPSFTFITEEVDLHYDYHCPLMSLPLAFKTMVETIPRNVPYLKVSSDHINKFKDRLSSVNKLKIGIAWRGNPNHRNDYKRSIDLSIISGLFDERYHWVILHNDLNKSEEKILSKKSISYFKDTNFLELSGVCENLDFIISVDTSIAHLCGALGKKVLLLLPYFCDFRWLLDKDKTDWYPTMKIFRNTNPQNWNKIFFQALEYIKNSN